jgi:hypothetical protein
VKSLLTVLKYAWAFLPNTAVGLLIALLSPRWTLHTGVLEVYGGAATLVCRRALITGGASAMTLGHVVIGRDAGCLDRTREHERVHVRQYERWGPLFFPAYLGCSIYLWLKGRDAYHENPFEVEAYSSTDLP